MTSESAEFTYVLIPADDALPLRELTANAVSCGDTLKELLRSHFAGGALTELDELRAQFGSKIDERLGDMQAVANAGTVEAMPLVRQSKTTLPRPSTATFLYFDEMGSLKDWAPNRRASALAQQCGLDLEHPLPGDVFVGRVCCDPGPISSSIAVHEIDSSAPWVRQAPAENAAFKDALADFDKVTQEKAVGAKTPEEQETEAEQRGWRWLQSESDIEVTVSVPAGTTKANILVKISRTSLQVALKADAAKPLVNLKLYAPVSADDSTWTLGADAKGPYVQITLEKEEEQTWPILESKRE